MYFKAISLWSVDVSNWKKVLSTFDGCSEANVKKRVAQS